MRRLLLVLGVAAALAAGCTDAKSDKADDPKAEPPELTIPPVDAFPPDTTPPEEQTAVDPVVASFCRAVESGNVESIAEISEALAEVAQDLSPSDLERIAACAQLISTPAAP